jgi:cob(I)alamin adenosyltransferase
MSIVTRTGDDGSTALMYGRRVSKNHPRVEAAGAVDELNAALGLARASVTDAPLAGRLLEIQNDLVGLMGELATLPADRERYTRDRLAVLTPAATERLDEWVGKAEGGARTEKGWAMPGNTASGATLDLARAVCRRAERCVVAIGSVADPVNPAILTYLNRLSDLLWLWARHADRSVKGERQFRPRVARGRLR